MSAAPAYIVTNRITGDTTITSGTEDSTYVLENLYNQNMAIPFKFTVTTGGWIEFDFGSTIAADTIAVLGHNFNSGATITLKSGNTPAPAATLATLTYRQYDIWESWVDLTHRYYRLEVSETNTENTMIGEIYIGSRVALSKRRSYTSTPGLSHQKVTHETVKGSKYVYSLFDRRKFEERFINLTDAQVAEINTLDAAVNGSETPFVWIPDTDEIAVYYVRKEDEYQTPNVTYNAWNVTLSLEEETRGDFVTL